MAPVTGGRFTWDDAAIATLFGLYYHVKNKPQKELESYLQLEFGKRYPNSTNTGPGLQLRAIRHDTKAIQSAFVLNETAIADLSLYQQVEGTTNERVEYHLRTEFRK